MTWILHDVFTLGQNNVSPQKNDLTEFARRVVLYVSRLGVSDVYVCRIDVVLLIYIVLLYLAMNIYMCV